MYSITIQFTCNAFHKFSDGIFLALGELTLGMSIMGYKIIYILLIILGAMSQTLAQPCDKMPLPDSTYLTTPFDETPDFSSREEMLKWEPTSWAMKYELEVRRDSILTDTVTFDDKLELYADWLCSTCNRYQLHPLQGRERYFWRVRAVNSCGNGPWSKVRSFKTGFNGEQGIRLHFVNVPDSIRYAVISPRAHWSTNYFNSVIKPIDSGTVDFTEEDYPYLYQADVNVLRIDFLAKESNRIYGHLEYNYRFASGFDKSRRVDIYVYFHPDLKSDIQYFPGWDYYSGLYEMPVSGLIPPSGLNRHINPLNVPALLMRGAGASGSFTLTSDSLRSMGIDGWQMLYPFDARIDTNAVILRRMIDTLSTKWYNGKRINIAAQGTAGLVARYAVNDTAYKGTINKIATLGTPHFGSFLAQRLLNTNTFDATVSPFIRSFDTQSPVILQSQVGSDFLRKLNQAGMLPLYPGNTPHNSYLAISGTKSLEFDIPHDEIIGASDGFISAASGSLLNFNIPFITRNVSHNGITGTSSYFDNTAEILAGFFDENYVPENPPIGFMSIGDGVWGGSNNIIKPDNRILNDNYSLIWFHIPGLEAPRCAFSSINSTITVIGEDKIPAKNTLYLEKQNGTYNFTSRFSSNTPHLGAKITNGTYALRLADYVTVMPEPKETKLTPLNKAIPVTTNVSPSYLAGGRTNFYTLQGDDPITSRWVLARNNRQNQPIFTSTEKRVLANFSRVDTVPFAIDQYMDTVLIILTAKDNISPDKFVKHGFKLKTPDGTVITPTTPQPEGYKPYERFGFRDFPEDRVSYYFIAKPKQGTWGAIYDTSAVRSWFTLSYLSEATLTVNVPDSIFKVNDKVPVTVKVLKKFFSEPSVTVTIIDGNGIKINTPSLKKISKDTYTGSYIATENGVFRVEARVIIDATSGRIDRTGYTSFEVYDAIPDRPTLLAPLNTAFDVPRATRLVWKNDKKVRSYLMQFSSDSKFKTFIKNEESLTDTSYVLSGLEPNKKYYWRIRGRNARGFGQWSDYFEFTTGLDILVTPRLIYPLDGTRTFSSDTTLSWTSISGAEKYRLQISKDSNFTDNQIALDNSINQTNFRFSMQPNTTYYWRVRAVSNVGTSGWSVFRKLERVLTPPKLIEPLNQSVNLPLSVTMKWSVPIKGLKFDLQISRNVNFSTIVAEVNSISDTTYTTIVPQNGVGYYWRVRWVLPSGYSDWSSPYIFTTILAAPKLDSPGDGVTGVNLTPTMTWRNSPNVGYFHLQVALDKDLTNVVYNDSLLTVVSIALKQLQPETQYWWRVRAKNAVGTSPWSEVWSFRTGINPNTSVMETVPGIVTGLYPNPNSGQFTLTFSLPLLHNRRFDITNAYGDVVTMVYGISGANSIDVHLNGLPSGVYYINGIQFILMP